MEYVKAFWFGLMILGVAVVGFNVIDWIGAHILKPWVDEEL